MQAYILSVVGMILLSVVAGLLLPEGKMSGYVKSTIALFLFFVIVSPIIKLAKGENIFSELEMNMQENFLKDTTASQVESIKTRVENSVKDNFKATCSVEILYENENGVACVKQTEIWITESETSLHTNELEKIKNHVAALLKIDKEQVVVYG